MRPHVAAVVLALLLAGCLTSSTGGCAPLGNGGVYPIADTGETVTSHAAAGRLLSRVADRNQTAYLDPSTTVSRTHPPEDVRTQIRRHVRQEQSNVSEIYYFAANRSEHRFAVSTRGRIYVVVIGAC